jgi:hypothetical protein
MLESDIHLQYLLPSKVVNLVNKRKYDTQLTSQVTAHISTTVRYTEVSKERKALAFSLLDMSSISLNVNARLANVNSLKK